jgi:hypothetical protein
MNKVGKGTLTADEVVKALYRVAAVTGSYNRITINTMRSFSDDLGTILAGYGKDTNYFNSLRLESSKLLTDAEKQYIKNMRNSKSISNNYGVLRFKAENTNTFKIPYSTDYGGTSIYSQPFTGNGFTKSSGKVTP